MTAQILKDVGLFYGVKDISGISNNVTVNYGADLQDSTVFCNDTRNRISGLLNSDISISGFWDADVDEEIFNSINLDTEEPLHIHPNKFEFGSTVFRTDVKASSYNQLGTIGEINPFSLELHGNTQLFKGQLFMDEVLVVGGETASGSIQLGAIPVEGMLWASLHILEVITPGEVFIGFQSDDSPSFSGPNLTDHIVFHNLFDTLSIEEYQFVLLDQTTTNDYWRFEWFIQSGEYRVVGVAGIKPQN